LRSAQKTEQAKESRGTRSAFDFFSLKNSATQDSYSVSAKIGHKDSQNNLNDRYREGVNTEDLSGEDVAEGADIL